MANDSRFKNKVAFITGGASGIGKRTAERFVAEGGRVVIADMSDDGMKAMKDALGEACVTVKTDVSKETDVEKAVAAAVSKLGKLDILVTCAGVSGLSKIVDEPLSGWEKEINVCLTGTFLCMKHVGKQLISQGNGGCIVNIASLNVKQPAKGMAGYCAAKAGVEMLTKVGAMEMAEHKIRVNCISPGLVATPMTAFIVGTQPVIKEYLENTPLGRSGTTDDIANAILFLASEEASYITAENLYIDGGSQTMRYPDLFKIIAAMQDK